MIQKRYLKSVLLFTFLALGLSVKIRSIPKRLGPSIKEIFEGEIANGKPYYIQIKFVEDCHFEGNNQTKEGEDYSCGYDVYNGYMYSNGYFKMKSKESYEMLDALPPAQQKLYDELMGDDKPAKEDDKKQD